jgi:hypothetical protein
MNRPLFIAAFVLIVASLSLSAQRGGGGHAGGGGGGHASFGGGHSGFGGGGHAFSAPRSNGFSGHSFSRGSTFNRGAFNRGAFNRGTIGRFGRNRSGAGVRIRSYPFYGRNCWGCWGSGWGYPYLGGGIDPYWWGDSDNDSDPSADAGQPSGYGYDNGLANQMNQQGIPMRPAPDPGSQDYYSRSTPPQQQHRPEQAEAAQPTVLVFRDQHQQEVQNYAIVGQTLWNFTAQRTQKISLSDLDIEATQKANDERGVSFRLPVTHEGQ